MKKIGSVCLAALTAAILFSACTAPAPEAKQPAEAEASELAHTQEFAPTPKPTPTPEPPDAAALLAEFSYGGPLPEALYPAEEERGYETALAHPEITEEIEEAFTAWAEEAGRYLSDECSGYYGEAWNGCAAERPEWQLLAAAALACEAPEDLPAVFVNLVRPETETKQGSGQKTVSVVLRAKTPQEAFPLPEEKGAPIPMEFFTATYLLTVYDDEGQLRENSGELAELSEKLTFPFAERYEFWDGWYLDRDGGTRRHTGTDILCPEGTPELACVDGTVLAVGSGEGTGNYVVIGGADGTQYHYYHMVEVSQFVSVGDRVVRGQAVGLAGNTGNSTTDHLHLAVIMPEGFYIDPYPYLMEAEDAPEK